MGQTRLSPRFADMDDGVPVFSRGRAPRWPGAVVLAAAALMAFIAVADDRLGLRLVMVAYAVTLVCIGVCLMVMAGSLVPRTVRIDTDAASLHFAPSARATVTSVVMGVSMLLPAIAQIIAVRQSLPTMQGIFITGGPYVLAVLGVAVVGALLWRLRTPAGLELSPEGLRGIRGSAAVDLPWDSLAAVQLASAPTARLSLIPSGGARPILVPMAPMGSDPCLVVPIVRYYLDHPEERALLAGGGEAAIRRVQDAEQTAPRSRD